MISRTKIEILDKDRNKLAEVLTPYPLDKGENILRYSKELSDYGSCKFRISSFDPLLTQYGDIIQPHKNHIRIKRNGVTVWQGAIVDNSKRTKDYIEIVAVEYLFYLGRKLVHRTSPDVNGTANIYRTFDSGTMAAAVTAMINETITDWAASHTLKGLTVGTMENPNYPPNTMDSNKNKLTGPWAFSKTLMLQYDFHTVLYILKAFGIYTYADFYIDNNLVFNFKKFVGNDKHYDVNFTYGPQGNIYDYNLPRFGQRMVNHLTGIATDTNGVVLHYDQSDETSKSNYGLMEGVAAYSDVKQQNILNARTQAELPLISSPDETNVSVVLNERGFPLGLYDIGDIVTIKVKNRSVNFSDIRRIVGISVTLHSTGREMTVVQTNKPLPGQFKATNISGTGV